MNGPPIALVAFQEQDNLGVGYLAAVLHRNGFDVRLLDFRLGSAEIACRVREIDPLVIGFSIIFQYHLEAFKELIEHLRRCGVESHFCAGGHYPSLRYRELMNLIPDLDSVVLFEGEHTFLELVQKLSAGEEWRDTHGLAHRGEDGPAANPLRPLEADLDVFPPPARQPSREYVLGRRYATILAGRGCVYDCAFCSIRNFYSRPPGPLKRLRRPEMVVREMELLHDERGCTIFMFQDDDFPAGGRTDREWIARFCAELASRDLGDRILWKINCRPDEIDEGVFRTMRDAGLFLVYLGIESGTDDGLRMMNKRLSVDECLSAVRRLGSLGSGYDFGFMLFDPSSTIDSVESNLRFLERLCGDGSSSITYCKMLPYAGTRIEEELRRAGRLTESSGCADYRFTDRRVDELFDWFSRVFSTWITGHQGVLNLSRWARYHAAVLSRVDADSEESIDLQLRTRELVSQSNRFFLTTVGRLVAAARSADPAGHNDALIAEVSSDVEEAHTRFAQAFRELMSDVTGAAAAIPAPFGSISGRLKRRGGPAPPANRPTGEAREGAEGRGIPGR